jgi:hypothetical protein
MEGDKSGGRIKFRGNIVINNALSPCPSKGELDKRSFLE